MTRQEQDPVKSTGEVARADVKRRLGESLVSARTIDGLVPVVITEPSPSQVLQAEIRQRTLDLRNFGSGFFGPGAAYGFWCQWWKFKEKQPESAWGEIGEVLSGGDVSQFIAQGCSSYGGPEAWLGEAREVALTKIDAYHNGHCIGWGKGIQAKDYIEREALRFRSFAERVASVTKKPELVVAFPIEA